MAAAERLIGGVGYFAKEVPLQRNEVGCGNETTGKRHLNLQRGLPEGGSSSPTWRSASTPRFGFSFGNGPKRKVAAALIRLTPWIHASPSPRRPSQVRDLDRERSCSRIR